MNDDELFARLQGADPARQDQPADSWLDDLVEETMSTPEQTPRRRWTPLAAAAAVIAIAAGGVGVAMNRGDDKPAPAAGRTVTELTLPGPAMGKCAPVSAAMLRNVDQALEATATAVSDDSVLLSVDKWFKGGTSDEVRLVPASTDMVGIEGAIEFKQGERYLISAAGGHVDSCGFSAPYSSELEAMFTEAFSG
jgi:hypothetical protein